MYGSLGVQGEGIVLTDDAAFIFSNGVVYCVCFSNKEKRRLALLPQDILEAWQTRRGEEDNLRPAGASPPPTELEQYE